MAQRRAHRLGATKEQVMCAHYEGIQVEVAQRILLLLRGLGRDRDQSREIPPGL